MACTAAAVVVVFVDDDDVYMYNEWLCLLKHTKSNQFRNSNKLEFNHKQTWRHVYAFLIKTPYV